MGICEQLGFGGVVIGKTLFDCIRLCLPDGATLLELGSGFGTEKLAEFYEMCSVEHEVGWLNRFDSVYIYAPLRDRWYDVGVLAEHLPSSYDAILVDGPPWYSGSRHGFCDHLDLFSTDGWLFFDDIHREDDMEAYRGTCNKLRRPHCELRDSEKAFGVIVAVDVTAQELEAKCLFLKRYEK